MAERRSSIHGLGSLQAELMEIVWELGEASVSQLHERLLKRRNVTYTTVLAAVQKLEKKAWLKHRSEGRAYVYWPARTRAVANRRLVKDLLQQAFDGDAGLLVAHLIEEHSMSDAELDELRRRIEARKRELRNA